MISEPLSVITRFFVRFKNKYILKTIPFIIKKANSVFKTDKTLASKQHTHSQYIKKDSIIEKTKAIQDEAENTFSKKNHVHEEYILKDTDNEIAFDSFKLNGLGASQYSLKNHFHMEYSTYLTNPNFNNLKIFDNSLFLINAEHNYISPSLLSLKQHTHEGYLRIGEQAMYTNALSVYMNGEELFTSPYGLNIVLEEHNHDDRYLNKENTNTIVKKSDVVPKSMKINGLKITLFKIKYPSNDLKKSFTVNFYQQYLFTRLKTTYADYVGKISKRVYYHLYPHHKSINIVAGASKGSPALYDLYDDFSNYCAPSVKFVKPNSFDSTSVVMALAVMGQESTATSAVGMFNEMKNNSGYFKTTEDFKYANIPAYKSMLFHKWLGGPVYQGIIDNHYIKMNTGSTSSILMLLSV